MSARERILARLNSRVPAKATTPPDIGAWYAAHRTDEALPERIQRFRTCMEAAHAEVHLVDENWPIRLHEILAAKCLLTLALAMKTPHGQLAWGELATSGIACKDFASPIEGWKSNLFNGWQASFTLARSAIAETGTLILWPSHEEPRTLSLVPPVHFVLLEAEAIHSTFYSAMQNEAWSQGLPTNALLISGPSKTADIQQTLAYGAHGPKELVVLLKVAQP